MNSLAAVGENLPKLCLPGIYRAWPYTRSPRDPQHPGGNSGTRCQNWTHKSKGSPCMVFVCPDFPGSRAKGLSVHTWTPRLESSLCLGGTAKTQGQTWTWHPWMVQSESPGLSPSAEPASPNQKASTCDTTASPATKNSVLLPVGVTTVGVFLPDLFQRQRSSSPPPDSLFRTPTADLHHYCHCPHAAPSGPLGTAAPATRRGTQPPAESRHSTVHSLLSSRSVVSDSLRPCGPQPVGVSRQEHGSGWLCPPPGDPPHPGTEATSRALAGGLFPAEPPGRPHQPQSLG